MKKTYKIEVDCANCAAKMETAINRIDGVSAATVSFMTQKLSVETASDDQGAIMQEIVKICKKIEPDCEIYLK
ncbi:MAG: heavy-metal-associated domain-containing protein [Ruminococcaceae bacterium]|nr:heavy-metal-associated domain-containing protein [Oscillospiraceae bacterium]